MENKSIQSTSILDKKINDKIWIFDKDSLSIKELNITKLEVLNSNSTFVQANRLLLGTYSADFKNDDNVAASKTNQNVTIHLTLESAQFKRNYAKDRYKKIKASEIRNQIKEAKRLFTNEELEDFKKSVIDVFGGIIDPTYLNKIVPTEKEKIERVFIRSVQFKIDENVQWGF